MTFTFCLRAICKKFCINCIETELQKYAELYFTFFRTVDASFQFYGQLEFVDFSNNQMSELPDKCFAKQSKLQHLQMDFNMIANITNLTFSGLKSLTYLSLRGNRLTVLSSHSIGLLADVSFFVPHCIICLPNQSKWLHLLYTKKCYLCKKGSKMVQNWSNSASKW